MNILLDTHAFLWFAMGDKQLPVSVRQIIEDTKNECFLSIASLWEITIKMSLGKLNIGLNLSDFYTKLTKEGIKILPINFKDLSNLALLPFHHKDPFDRIIIAQAISNYLVVASQDAYFNLYPIKIQWN